MRRWTTMAGSLLAALVMAGVLYRFGGDLKRIDFDQPHIMPKLAGSVVIYVLVMVMAAFGWKTTLRAFGANPAIWAAERQMLISQIGKYVPGNVVQYVGRAAMAVRSGIPGKTVAMALFVDTVAIIASGVAAVVLVGIASPRLPPIMPDGLAESTRASWLAVAIALPILLLLCASVLPALSKLKIPRLHLRWIAAGLALYTLSFLLLGLSLHLVVSGLAPGQAPIALSVGIFAAGWVAGLVTPGAPGGLGVRESVITLGLAPFLGGAVALSAALLHRGISVLGDVLSFGLGQMLPAEGTKERS